MSVSPQIAQPAAGNAGDGGAAPSQPHIHPALLRNVRMHARPLMLGRPGARPLAEMNEAGAGGASGAANLQSALADLEAEHHAARDAGYQAGFEQGLAEGLLKGEKQGRAEGQAATQKDALQELQAKQDAVRSAAEERFRRLDRMLSSLPDTLARSLQAAEDDMVDLSLAVICRLFGQQLQTREGIAHWIRQAIIEATTGAAGHAELNIHVHPEDFAFFSTDDMFAKWLRQNQETSIASVNWIADQRVEIGGCIVSTSGPSLDARIETRLHALRELLCRRPVVDSECVPADAEAVRTQEVS